MKAIKFIFFISILINCSVCFANNDNKLQSAFEKTQYGKNFKKRLNTYQDRIKKIMPKEFAFLSVIAVEQKLEFNYDKYNRLLLDYRNQKIMYKFDLDF